MFKTKKKIRKKKIRWGYNHGYGRAPSLNRTLAYFGTGLIFISFCIAGYYIKFSDLPMADKAEYKKERVIVGTPSGFGIPDGEI